MAAGPETERRQRAAMGGPPGGAESPARGAGSRDADPAARAASSTRTARGAPPDTAGWIAVPPYAHWAAFAGPPRPHRDTPGTVVGVRVSGTEEGWQRATATIAEARAHAAGVAVVIYVDEAALTWRDAGLALTRLAVQASRMHARAVLMGVPGELEEVRAVLSTPVDVARDLIEWLRDVAPIMSATLEREVERLVRAGAVRGCCCAASTNAAVRLRFRRAGLAPPVRWVLLGRALRAATYVQQHPASSFERAAHDLGLADQSVLSRLLVRAFGARPSVVRGALGWEWMVVRWLAHALPKDADARQVRAASWPAATCACGALATG